MRKVVKKGKVTTTYYLSKSDILEYIESCDDGPPVTNAFVALTKPGGWDPNVNSSDTFIAVSIEHDDVD